MGGRDSRNNTPSKIAEFNPTQNVWNELAQELHSRNTSELIITPFPETSLDCVPDCRCGVASKEERIFGGQEAKVGKIQILITFITFITRLERATEAMQGKTSA